MSLTHKRSRMERAACPGLLGGSMNLSVISSVMPRPVPILPVRDDIYFAPKSRERACHVGSTVKRFLGSPTATSEGVFLTRTPIHGLI